MSSVPYKSPSYHVTAFNCPQCLAFAEQDWKSCYLSGSYSNTVHKQLLGSSIQDLEVAFCSHCKRYSSWWSEKMVYPDVTGIIGPNEDLDDEIKADYMEAANIVMRSPRGATALLRLCIQKLCVQMNEKGKNINEDIASLVQKGLPVQIQQALDIVRVVGNSAVHPGQIDLKDDSETANKLFGLVNIIAQIMITQPKEIQAMYGSLPKSQLDAINRRDKLV